MIQFTLSGALGWTFPFRTIKHHHNKYKVITVSEFTLKVINWYWRCCVNRGLYHVITLILARFLELDDVFVGDVLSRSLAVIFAWAIIVVVFDNFNVSTELCFRCQRCWLIIRRNDFLSDDGNNSLALSRKLLKSIFLFNLSVYQTMEKLRRKRKGDKNLVNRINFSDQLTFKTLERSFLNSFTDNSFHKLYRNLINSFSLLFVIY